ncbi:MAG: M14 family zinc carboxypeptidase [Oligoflexales bacterium]
MRWQLGIIIAFLTLMQGSYGLSQNSSDPYRRPQEIINTMANLAQLHSNAQLLQIGETLHQDPLFILKITPLSQKEDSKSSKGVFIIGGHHGNEGPSPEVVIDLAVQILSTESNPAWFKRTLYIMPIASPVALSRRSRHTHQHDLNRDYPYPGRPDTKPAFQTVESQAIDAFLKKTHISHAITVHSGIKAVLYPNGFQKNGLNADDQKYFEAIARKSAEAMKIDRFLSMWDSYPTYGSFIDYAYHSHGIIALNFEISEKHHPLGSELHTISAHFQKGIEAFFDYAFSGTQKDATIAASSQEVSKRWQKSPNSIKDP